MAGTLVRFPKRRSIETQLLLGLQKLGPKNDLLGALNFVRREGVGKRRGRGRKGGREGRKGRKERKEGRKEGR